MALEDEWDLAVHSALSGDATLSAAVTGVYTGVAPQSKDSGDVSAFPYVIIDRVDFTEYSDSTHTGFETFMTIKTHDRSPSRKLLRQIQGMIFNVLHRKNANLSVTGHSVILIDRDSSDVEEPFDKDGQYEGTCEYRVLITRNDAD